MKKSMVIVGSFLLMALTAGSVFAWGPGRGMMGSGFNQDCRRIGGQGAWNNLSRDQKDELNSLRQAFIDETYTIRSQKFQKQQEMRILMETSSPDRAELSKLSREITDLQKQLRDKRIDFQLNAKKISPELGMGQRFGMGRYSRYNWSHRGGHRGGQWPGQENGCYYNN